VRLKGMPGGYGRNRVSEAEKRRKEENDAP
jgi:hypothetical protein